jgi:hypothetical protein
MKKTQLLSKKLSLEIDQFLKIEKIKSISANNGPCTCPEEIDQNTPLDELCAYCQANILFAKIKDELKKKDYDKKYFFGQTL